MGKMCDRVYLQTMLGRPRTSVVDQGEYTQNHVQTHLTMLRSKSLPFSATYPKIWLRGGQQDGNKVNGIASEMLSKVH